MMKKRLIVFAFAGMLAVGMSSCGKKEVSSNRVQSTVSEAETENSISEKETPVLSEEQPEQEESEEVQGNITQNTEDKQIRPEGCNPHLLHPASFLSVHSLNPGHLPES